MTPEQREIEKKIRDVQSELSDTVTKLMTAALLLGLVIGWFAHVILAPHLTP